MCNYCSCRSMPVIEELGAAHAQLGVLADAVRRALAGDDVVGARSVFGVLVRDLRAHTTFEEATVFAALQAEGEMGDDVAALLDDHRRALDAADGLAADDPSWPSSVVKLLDDLHSHIAREEYDLFPAMLMALSPAGWDAVERSAAHHG